MTIPEAIQMFSRCLEVFSQQVIRDEKLISVISTSTKEVGTSFSKMYKLFLKLPKASVPGYVRSFCLRIIHQVLETIVTCLDGFMPRVDKHAKIKLGISGGQH
eukprot:TRINITY_DN251_c0_g1_i2.p3 TRINITY_DN251_c0_g1~~TRINITY_DN251_c0_g1_i2.p3  ORF type:complete len:103 (-),score=21.12 TRINITY_DN251_c0_g1_i2:976-1284(-)